MFDTLRLMKEVLVPYKFTLLSNRLSLALPAALVLVPYKFTLLSNPQTSNFDQNQTYTALRSRRGRADGE